MKHETIKLVCLLFACLFSATPFVASAAPEANPYGLIAQKNSFRLQPLVQSSIEVPRPSAKIVLQGMTTALGRRQALMKLALPGDPHEIFVILDEGGQVAEVKVIQIDAANRNVSVLNGEKWQMLFLEVSDPASPTSVQQ